MDTSFKAYLKTLKKVTICPYCQSEVQIDPHMGCCGEVHAEVMYDDGEEYIEESALTKYHDKWLEKLDGETSGRDPMTIAKTWREDHE